MEAVKATGLTAVSSRVWHGEFQHPRLVEIYDAQFCWSRDDDFFFVFVNQTPSVRLADLGSGTSDRPLTPTLRRWSLIG